MTDENVRKILKDIEKAEDIEQLKGIEQKLEQKFRINTKRFPKFELELSKEDLIKLGINSNSFCVDDTGRSKIFDMAKDNPLAKLFLAVAWKAGYFAKTEYVVRGILDEVGVDKDSVVLLQFGKHVANKTDEPIIDQHVIRAFAASKESSSKIGTLSRNEHAETISGYKEWLKGIVTKFKKEESCDALYYIDRILYAVGKSIKQSRNSKN